jgi:hypothetical protein
MRLILTLLFFTTLALFAWSALQYLMSRFARPLDRHRREHEHIHDRLSELERNHEAPLEAVPEGEPRRR